MWPLFARAPRHWFLENFLLSAPGVQSVFFFAVALRWAPRPFGGARAKKKHHPVVFFFFCCGPARTLTHSLRAWVAMPPPRRGGVFFFAAAPPGPGWCFFFAVAPPGRSLTHGGLGRFRQGPGGVFFFLLRPRRVFLDNNKKCLGYYIGSKKTRRGHSKKKNTTSEEELKSQNLRFHGNKNDRNGNSHRCREMLYKMMNNMLGNKYTIKTKRVGCFAMPLSAQNPWTFNRELFP